jgi:dihydroflavonol-4-reductase
VSTGGKKVLITGGNGFLGSNTARELYRRGYEIKLMMRPSADASVVADIPCEIFYGEIRDMEDVLKAVSGCDYVVHTASVTAQWGVDQETYQLINYKGTMNVAEACTLQGVEKLIHISTANTIGPGSRDKPADELYSFGLTNLSSGYVSSKYIAQQYVLEQVERRGLRAVVINPTFMLGAYDARPSSGKLILHGMNKRLFFYPSGGKNFVAVNDVAVGIANAIERGRIGECYLMAGENLSYREFFQLLRKVSGQRPVMIQIPELLLKMFGILGTLLSMITGRATKLSYSSAYMLSLYNYYSGRKSERELGVSYLPAEKAIENALRWFKENNYC